MKPIIISLLICFVQQVSGQNTPIVFNDNNFENYCLTHFDTNNNGQVESNEVMNVTLLNINNLQINNLQGISFFASLESLNVGNNNLTSLNLSNNTSLLTINANSNNLQSININGCTRLKNLILSFNALTTIDLSTNTALKYLDIPYNNLISLDVSNNNNLTALIAQHNSITTQGLNLAGAVNLLTLFLNNNNFDSINVNHLVNLDYMTITHNNLTSVDLRGCSSLRSVNLSNNNITNLHLDNLASLKYFYAGWNSLSSINVSTNTNLILIALGSNNLNVLDVSNNQNLITLNAPYNNLEFANLANGSNNILTNVRLDSNPNLTCISVDDPTAANLGNGVYGNWQVPSNITYGSNCWTYVPDDIFEQYIITYTNETGPIDDYVLTENIENIQTLLFYYEYIQDFTGLEGFTALEELLIWDAPMAALDVSANTNLWSLELIDVTNLTGLTYSGSTNLALDEIKIRNALSLTQLNVSNLDALQNLSVTNTGLSQLTIEGNPQLKNINIEKAPLNGWNLKFPNCPLIKKLELTNVGVSNLDIMGLASLEKLTCTSSSIAAINLTQNTNLNELTFINNTNLSNLNIANTNNINIQSFLSHSNALLSCINVDDPLVATAGQTSPYTNWGKDLTSQYSNSCAITTGISVSLGRDFKTCEGEIIDLNSLLNITNGNCQNYSAVYYYMDQGQQINVNGNGFTALYNGGSIIEYFVEYTDHCSGFTYTNSVSIMVLKSTSRFCQGMQRIAKDSNLEKSILVYPNPINNEPIYIANNSNSIITFQIFDIYGNELNTGSVSSLNKIKLNIIPNNSKVFFIKIYNDSNEAIVRKIIVQ